MADESMQEHVVVQRTLMTPQRIRLNAIVLLALAGLVFWISTTLPAPLNKYSWIGTVGFAGSAILAIWVFVVAQRRQWWLNEQAKKSEVAEVDS